MSQMIYVRGVTKTSSHEAHVWVKSRSEFALEILSLVEQGVYVEMKSAEAPKDNAIQTSDIEKEFASLVEKAQSDTYFED